MEEAFCCGGARRIGTNRYLILRPIKPSSLALSSHSENNSNSQGTTSFGGHLERDDKLLLILAETLASPLSSNRARRRQLWRGASRPTRLLMKSRVGMRCNVTKCEMLSNSKSRSPPRREIFLR